MRVVRDVVLGEAGGVDALAQPQVGEARVEHRGIRSLSVGEAELAALAEDPGARSSGPGAPAKLPSSGAW